MLRLCSPRCHSALPHVAHCGGSCSLCWLHDSTSPICIRSCSICARTWFICSSTAASISAHVALGCSFLHCVIPSRSPMAALTCWICSLRCRRFFFSFMLSSLPLWLFLSSLPPPAFCAKIDPVGERLREQGRQSVRHECHRGEHPSTRREDEKR